MQDFINKLENLSLELFLEIFEYLSITDCFNAFYNLNWKINSALNLSGLSIDLTSVSQNKYKKFYEEIIFINHYDQIRQLKISNDSTINLIDKFFSKYDLRDLSQLCSLTLIKPSYMILSSLALIISDLEQLKYLSIDSNSYPENFFRSIATKSVSIKSCYLSDLEIQDELTFESNIEYLTVTVEDITILCNILTNFPKLKYLQIVLRSSLDLEENSLTQFNVICENLEIFKIYLLERSSIDFNEMECFFQQILFKKLQTFSYNCVTSSLNHLNVTRWNEILSKYLSTINKLNFFVQIPLSSYSYDDIQQTIDYINTNLCYSFPLSLSMNSLYYMIHTDIYPKIYFDLSSNVLNFDKYLNSNPINCNTIIKYSKVNSLVVNSQLLSSDTILPKNIKHLHIQGQNKTLTLDKCLKNCSKELLSLKIFGLPNDLPHMPNLQKLTIQQVMFNSNMITKLSSVCPRLEMLTIEIDSIKQFRDLLNQLRNKSNLKELKFIRAFSRDSHQTWPSWVDEWKKLNDNINYDIKNLFLFIWL